MRFYLLFILLSIGTSITYSQDCPPTLPLPECPCDEELVTLCGTGELVEYCFKLTSYQTPFSDFPGCAANVLNNPRWLSFRTSEQLTSLQISSSNCQGSGAGGATGIQAALYESDDVRVLDCNLCNPAAQNFEVVATNCACVTGPIIWTNIQTDPDKTYYLVIDGCAGEQCDIFIDILSNPDTLFTCPILNVEAEAYNCSNDSFDILISLELDGIGCSPSYGVSLNGIHVGSYTYTQSNVWLESIPESNDPSVITVHDLESDTCVFTDTIPPVNCSECGIEELVAEVDGCTGDSTYRIHVNINFSNDPGDTVDIYAGNIYVGSWVSSEFPIVIHDFPWFGKERETIIACDSDEPGCCSVFDYFVPDCLYDECQIFDLIVEAYACENDSFLIDLDFGYNYQGSDSFKVVGNGNNYGNFSYDDLYLTLGPFPANGTEYEFGVIDLENGDCGDFYELGDYSCDCSIRDLDITHIECDGDSVYFILDFFYSNVGENGFEVTGNGNNYGIFEYENLPIAIGPHPINDTEWEFIVRDVDMPDCAEDLGYGMVDCNNECEIFDLVVEVGECTSDSTYVLHINFESENTGGLGFDVWANGEYFEFFTYSELPLVIEHFPKSGGNNDWIKVCDNDNLDCCAVKEFDSPNCDGNDECDIRDLTATVIECDEDSFYVKIDFIYENVGDDGFEIRGNGTNYGIFEYGDLPIILGPFPIGEIEWEFVVIDVQNEDCREDIDLGRVLGCDEECEIFDLVIDVGECTSDSTYQLLVDFEYIHTGGLGFDVWANGEYFEFFTYSELPLVIEHFPKSGGNNDWIKVCDNDNLDCCAVKEFDSPNCEGNDECDIRDLTATVIECDEDSFYVKIDFIYENVGDDGFEIRGNGTNYGIFEYGDLPIILGPFPIGEIEWEFVIIDVQNEDCREDIDLGKVENCNDECEIHELEINNWECTSDSTYTITIDFEYSNPIGPFFDLWANGEFFGFYEYSDLPLTIEHFPKNGGSHDWIKVCDNDNPDCCRVLEFESPDCTTAIGEPEWGSGISIFPNPTSDRLKIEWGKEVFIDRVEIYNMQGQKVITLPGEHNKISINTYSFAEGVYVFKIQSGGEYITRRVMVIR